MDVYGKTFRQISKQIALIKEYIVDIIELKNDDIIIKNMIDLLSYKMEEIKNYVNKAMKLSIVWETLTEKRWSLRNRELDEPAKLEPPNSRKLSSLIVDLASLNDAKREQAFSRCGGKEFLRPCRYASCVHHGFPGTVQIHILGHARHVECSGAVAIGDHPLL